jgi:RND superfamily putative drug exporter
VAADPRVRTARSIITVARAAGMGRSALVFLPDSATAGLVSEDGQLAAIEVIPHERITPDEMTALVRTLRTRDGTNDGVRLLVGGLPAFNLDYADASAGRFPHIALAVVLGTLVALCMGTRSLLVPLKAAALNLLVVAAAFGAVTIVFQDGHGGSVFGVDEPLHAVFSTLPVIVFCVVYGLSMDYEVFLVSRVLEARRNGASDRDAIIDAVGSTAQLITGAAAIMLVVFLTFAMGDLLFTKMLGFALATAVLLDATVVRLMVGPALLQLAGRWNWWPGSRS